MPVHSGNVPSGDHIICRLLRLPADNPEFTGAFTGKLLELTDPKNWDDRIGTLSAVDAATLAKDILFEMLESDVCMLGEIKMYAREIADLPDGVLLCDGSIYQKADYPRLYDILPTNLIIDAFQFRVPDLTDKFVVATGSRNFGDVGGSETHTLTTSEMPAHSHTSPAHTHTSPPHAHQESIALPMPIVGGVEAPQTAAVANIAMTSPATVIIDPATVTINQEGGGAAHNNLPPFYALVFGIQAR